jgi:secondary thiamine-phosphate synthase enzyme
MSTDWLQSSVELPRLPRGFHLVTRHVTNGLAQLSQFRVGLLHVFLQHTSASLSLNENADPDVPLDLEDALTAIAPEDFPYRHTCEGSDDMPAHVKSSLLGCALTIPVADGRLCLGTWQGIYLCEHRNRAQRRKLILTVYGQRYE